MKDSWELSDNAGISICIVTLLIVVGVNLVLHVGSHSIAEAIATTINPREVCNEQL